ncbi:MAG: efflux RND transporter periplasmic adaptor subunit [Verrucomicrobiales bacterium]|nr:efflux RND transporter periplasmic adaptor subunit [Verrucomicrobiales bacterium]
MAVVRKKILGWAAAAVLVLGCAAYWYFAHAREKEPEYQTAIVERGDLVQVVTATGQLNPMTNVTVGSQISGIIQKIYVDFNSPVKAGQVIAELDPATYRAAVAQAEGELANAKANLELAQIQAKRAAELFKDNLISAAEYDTAMAQLHQAEAQVKIRQAVLSNAQVNLSRCTIYAPIDGIVISRNVDVGQTVAASLQAPTLFQIANDLTQMQINANVAEADIGNVEVGQDVEFTVDAYPYRTFHGKVKQVRNSAVVVQNVVTYDTVIEVSNPDLKLKPGMTANVSIITARRQTVLKIPNAALRFRPPEAMENSRTNTGALGRPGQRQSGPGAAGAPNPRMRAERAFVRTVYVLSTNSAGGTRGVKLEPVQIKVGITDGIMTEVVEGLKEGDVVVTGVVMPEPQRTASAPPRNPFGGVPGPGFRRF